MPVEVYFEDIEYKLLSEINKAKNQILVAVAWLTNPKLFRMLCQMADNYVDVQILIIKDDINMNSQCDYEQLVKLGGKVFWQESQKSLMHHKFCIIDKKTVITGSYNWTSKAENNFENISIIRDEINATDKYFNEFKNLLPSFNEAIFYDNGFLPAEYFDTHEKRHNWFKNIPENWKSTLIHYADSYLGEFKENRYWNEEYGIMIYKESSYENQLSAIFQIKEIICSRTSTLEPLRHLTNLEKITVLGNHNHTGIEVSDLSPLSNLLNLKEFSAEGSLISDLKPLKKLKKIQELKLSHNPISSLDGIGELERIKVLYLEMCNINTLYPIRNYSKLVDFRVSNNNIDNIDFLSNNHMLTRVEFANNRVSKINHLSLCADLENITFYNNNVTDISQLYKLKKLKYIYPSGNSIDQTQIKEFAKFSKAFICDFSR